MSAQPKQSSVKRKYRQEFFLVTVFFFVLFGMLSLILINLSLFTPFKEAFKDFSLSDFYYSKLQNRDRIYNGPLVLVNGESRSREEIQFLLQRLEQGAPKAIGLDLITPAARDSGLLSTPSGTSTNIVYAAIPPDYSDHFPTNNNGNNSSSDGFINSWEQRDFTTIRSFAPYRNNGPAFSTALIQKFNAALAVPLLKDKKRELDIRFWGNVKNFRHFSFDSVMDPAFDLGVLKGKIVLVGYFGSGETISSNSNDGLFYTPLNEELAGRSYPDMYGSTVHANILRMALDKDYIKTIPSWLNWIIAFLLCWLLVPLFVKWYVFKPMWSHMLTKSIQLTIIVLLMYLTIVAYAFSNIKIEPALVLASVLLLGDAVLFYDGLVKFLKHTLRLPIQSIYFEH